MRTCYICHKRGHIAKDCRYKPPVTTAAGVMLESFSHDQHEDQLLTQGESTQCSQCHKPIKTTKPTETTACIIVMSLTDCCKQDNHVTLQCGHKLPIMSAVCRDQQFSGLPIKIGFVEGSKVPVLRDSECSGVVVRQSLVPNDQLTGEHRSCVMLDGTVRNVPVAKIYVNTPFFAGTVTALCMQHPVFDLVLGNIDGVRCPTDPDPNWSKDLQVNHADKVQPCPVRKHRIHTGDSLGCPAKSAERG